MSLAPGSPRSVQSSRIVADLMAGFRASKAMFAAVELGLFDTLHHSPLTTNELAGKHGLAQHALERLLGFLASQGLITLDADKHWKNLEPAERFLRRDSPETLAGYILYSDRILYRLWDRLPDALREGTHRWEQEFGQKDDIFDHFFSTDDDKERFLQGMNGLGLLGSPQVVEILEPGRFRRLADWGGGTAHLAIAACRRDPTLEAVIWDLPSVQPVAERYIRNAGLAERITAQPGNFFSDEPPAADLVSMSRILHDWSDDKVRSLLRRAHESLPPEGALLIAEQILDADKCGPAGALLQSLNMLVCTEGHERTADEYEALCREAGFTSFESRLTDASVDAMLAHK